MRRLFVISEPLQYLQALELFQEGEERVLLILKGDKDFITPMIDKNDWKEIIYIDFLGSSWDLIINRRTIGTLIQRIGRVEEVILSSYCNNLMNHLAHSYPHAKRILLEDGTVTLILGEYIRENKKFKYLIKYALYKFLGLHIQPLSNLSLFTIYRNLDVKPLGNLVKEVVTHDYRRFRERIVASNPSEDASIVYLLTSNYSQLGMLPEEKYVVYISKILDFYKHRHKVVKIMIHRFESVESYSCFVAPYGVEVIKPDIPIELYFFREKIYPVNISTMGSGATYTLDVLYNPSVKVFAPKLECFNTHKKQMKIIFSEMNKKFNVIDL